jgi:hypothetical protein
MNPLRGILIVVVLGVLGLLHVPSSAAPLNLHQVSVGFDLEACQEECRIRYSYELYRGGGRGGGGSGVGAFYGLARCVERCKRQFWKDFDQESDDLLD